MPLVRLSAPPLPDNMGKRAPLLQFLLIIAVGICCGWWTRNVVSTWTWIIATACCLLLALCLLKGKNKMVRALAALAMAASLSFLGAAWCAHRYDNICVNWPQKKQLWVAQVEQIKKVKENRTLIVAATKNNNHLYDKKLVQLNLQGTEAKSVRCGQLIAFKTLIKNKQEEGNPGDFDFQKYLIQHGVCGSAVCAEGTWHLLNTSEQAQGAKVGLSQLRQHLVDCYARYFRDTDLSVLAALTLGDKSLITSDTQQLFSNTGTSHVLALSGLHIGILISLFNMLLLKRLRRGWWRWTANLFLLAMLWGFAFLVGAPISLLRAVLMFSFMQMSQCLQRTHSTSLNNLTFAALLLLVIDPFTLFDVSFQLSFVAVFFIICTNDYVLKRYRLPLWRDSITDYYLIKKETYKNPYHYFRYVRLPLWRKKMIKHSYLFLRSTLVPFICISVSAQWGTAPLVLYYFHTFAPYAWLANFVVIPAAYVLLSLSLVFLLFPFVALQTALAKAIAATLHVLTQSLQAISNWPFATCHVYITPFTLTLIWLVPILLFFFFETRKAKWRKVLLCASFALLTIGVCYEAVHAYTEHITPRIYVYKVAHTSAVHFVQSNPTSYLLSSTTTDSTLQRLQTIKANFWDPHHMAAPTLLTHERADYPTLQRARHLLLFHHKRIVFLNADVVMPDTLAIDLLIVAHGGNAPSVALPHSLSRVKQVVLDGSVSNVVRRQWKAACRLAHTPCYDVQLQGAFVWVLP